MASTQHSATSTAFRTPLTVQPGQNMGRPVSAEDSLIPAFKNEVSREVVNRFGEKFRVNGIDFGPEESHELTIFDEFLEHHVQANGICDVQCMLLWSEWLRSFRSRASGFPKLIREKEFRNAITDRFGIVVANLDIRGAVYSGIKFIR